MENSEDLDQVLKDLDLIEQRVNQKRDKRGKQEMKKGDKKREDIKEWLESKLPKIQVFGVGGAGNNTVTNLNGKHERVETIAVNTDAHQLLSSNADELLLLGKDLCNGHGAGNRPEIGEKAAKESTDDLKAKLNEGDLIFLTCGLGGGTGTGATPYIAEIANRMDKTVVSVCTLPFAKEGKTKMRNAEWGLKRILEFSDTKIIVPNENLLNVAPNAGIMQAFQLVDDILVKAITGISDLITDTNSVINVDYEDVRKTLSSGGTCLIGIGEIPSGTKDKGRALIKDAIENPLLRTSPESAKNALLNIYGGNSLSLREATDIVGSISELIGEEKEIIWGLTVREEFSDVLRAVVMLSGIRPKFINGEGKVELSTIYSLEEMREESPFDKIPRI
ncbi:MAG: cell division protein FtsZ [Candidatus Korarchaeota archaeon]|nr:cell division protein FtsZ [Candidatus Korarchaeota archaeon]NIU84623.1 cell division protein FtsZ [Candidatus Thorarchaeota archaeon]NIW12765.1 cell division protein FtsZ [Candidatus Thorarchaeota archaeon]NIW50972.1 cell division protein FtsZ [Candidatus Korarchaeota archaeon]